MPVVESKAGRSRVPKSSASAQQASVAGQLVAREQPAEVADGDLEVLDVDVSIEREIFDDELARRAASSLKPMMMSVSSESTGVIRSGSPYQSCGFFVSGLSSSCPHAWRS